MVWKLCENCAFPQNFHTMKLGEITVFHAVPDIWTSTGTLELTIRWYLSALVFKTFSENQSNILWLYVLIMSRTRLRVNLHDKNIGDMIRTYNQMHRTDKYSQRSTIIWPVWVNGWVFVYEVESHWSHLNFRYCTCFEQGVPWYSDNYGVWIKSKTRTWHDKNIRSKFHHQKTILNFWKNFPKQGYFQTKTEKINITTELFIFELVQVSNFTLKKQFWILGRNLPETRISGQNRNSEYHH